MAAEPWPDHAPGGRHIIPGIGQHADPDLKVSRGVMDRLDPSAIYALDQRIRDGKVERVDEVPRSSDLPDLNDREGWNRYMARKAEQKEMRANNQTRDEYRAEGVTVIYDRPSGQRFVHMQDENIVEAEFTTVDPPLRSVV